MAFSNTPRVIAGFPAPAGCAAIRSSSTQRPATHIRLYRLGRHAPIRGQQSTWSPVNKNVAAEYFPDPYPEIGQCVHKLLLHPARPERLWQQNHFGVYRSDNCGDSWERLDGNGLPTSFGFPIMIDPKDPDAAFVIPERSPEYHYSPNRRLAVYRTRDSGQTWEEISDGLPRQAWAAVLREASASDADSLYFGTQSGSFFALADGDTWVEAARHLPPVLSVEVTQWFR